MIAQRQEHTLFQGITEKLTRKKIRKCRQRLGNGHDMELHVTVAQLYQHLGEDSLALESYQLAVKSLLQHGMPLTSADSDHLIKIYKRILECSPFNEEIAEKLGQEYLRRGWTYRAVELHTTFAERYARKGEYHKATQHYQAMFAIEPGSISARITCALLYCQLRDYENAARQYEQIGKIYFDHQRFDGAVEYYQQAVMLSPETPAFRERLQLAQQIVAGTVSPQAYQQAGRESTQQTSALQQSLAEKEQVERELRRNIAMLKQRYEQTTTLKNEQLRATQKRLDELSAHVAAAKDSLEQIAAEKQRLEAQLAQEAAYKRELEQKLAKLSALEVGECEHRGNTQRERSRRLDAVTARLHHEKGRLEHALHDKLRQVQQREEGLRRDLQAQASRGSTLEHQLQQVLEEHTAMEQRLQQQLHESLQREHALQTQVKTLIYQHEQVLLHVTDEKRMYAEKYQHAQAGRNQAETDSMSALERLNGELSRQSRVDHALSNQFRLSLEEIRQLLHSQEEAIHTLEQL